MNQPQADRLHVPLCAERLAEMYGLVARLGQKVAPADGVVLLAEARTALHELLVDHADLTRANAEAGAELALWTGAL